jgi:phosphoglycerate dehydrogenase-like enzyme
LCQELEKGPDQPMQHQVLLDISPFNLPKTSRMRLREACGDAAVVETTDATPLEELDGSQTDVLLAEEIPQNLAAWPQLRFVQLVSAGINHLKGHPIWQTDIAVANASGTHSVPIAQYVTCAVLMTAHRMLQITLPATVRQWSRDEFACSVVRGQTVGILGYGSIGRECARQLHALGMKVVCLKRNPANRRDEGYTAWPETGDPEGKIPERWFGPGQLREMLALCDVLVVTAPSTAETFNMIDRAELALMKQTSILIIVARGGIVNESALAEALRQRQLAGAVVDCFATEPIPADHFFFDMPNLVLTPHMSGVLDNFWPVMANLLRENLQRFVEGNPLLNRVNPNLGY